VQTATAELPNEKKTLPILEIGLKQKGKNTFEK